MLRVSTFRSCRRQLANLISRSFSLANANFKLQIQNIEDDKKREEIRVSWDNNKVSRFPYLFLRDNCLCSSCYHPTSGQSLVLINDTLNDASAGTTSVSLDAEQAVSVQWACGHDSRYELDWLEKRGFFEDVMTHKRLHPVKGLRRALWGSEQIGNMKFVEFSNVLEKDDSLYDWMKTLATVGVIVLKNAPQAPNQLKRLGKRASCDVMNTMYGKLFTVKDKPDATNVAYTSGYLAMHTDQPYYINQPGFQFLHCINGTVPNEGVNHLIDGFKIAHDFKLKYPDDFNILTTLTLPFIQRGNEMFGEFTLAADRPVIGLNQYGEVERISHNYPSSEAAMNHTPEETKLHYKALGRFVRLMYEPAYLAEYHLEPGDILCFDNRRVLHGRTPYDPTASERWLEGSYVNWDDFYARLRALHEKFTN